MHQVTVGTSVVAIGPPKYVRLHDNGFFLPCDEKDAQAIVAEEELYAISEDIPVPGHPDAELAVIRVIADDSYTSELLSAKTQHTIQIADLEESAAAQTIESTARLDDIEQVLGELLVRGID